MGILLFLAIYALGCVLAYGRITGIYYQANEDCLSWSKPDPVPLYLVITSWISFMIGVAVFFKNGDKYFFKWSQRDLFKKYKSK